MKNSGDWRGGRARGVKDFFGMSFWKDIRKGWEDFSLRLAIQLKNGRRTKWDICVKEIRLKDAFPMLFKIFFQECYNCTFMGGKRWRPLGGSI